MVLRGFGRFCPRPNHQSLAFTAVSTHLLQSLFLNLESRHRTAVESWGDTCLRKLKLPITY